MIEPGDLETRQPHDGESLYGFIASVAAKNDLIRVALIAASDRTHGHRQQLWTAGREELQSVADLLEVDVSALADRTLQVVADNTARWGFFGTTVAKQDIRIRTRFFSPSALVERPYHRAMWQLRIPFDTETGEILVSSCGMCGQTQRWRHTAGVDCCDGCGESLQKETDRIDDDILPDAALAIGLTHTDPAKRAASLALLPDEIASLGAATAYELLLRLVPVVENTCSWSSGDRLWRNDPHAIARGMHRAWRTLTGWPHALRDRLDRDLASSATRHSDGNKGATTFFLKLRNSRYLPHPMRKVIARLHTSIDLSGPNGAHLRSITMTCKEVSKELGDGTARIVAYRREGFFRTVGLANADRMASVFDRSEIEVVATDYRRRCDFRTAGVLLGMPNYAVERLCASGRLPALTHPYIRARFDQPVTTKDAIDELARAIASRSSPCRTGEVPLLDAMRAVGGRLKPWDTVVEAILDGQIRFSLDPRKLSLCERVRVLVTELEVHAASPVPRRGITAASTPRVEPGFPFFDLLSKADAAEVLNLGSAQSTTLLSSFPTSRLPSVPVADVERLARDHVTNTEIAASVGCDARTVISVARGLGVRQLSEAGYGRHRKAEIIDAVKKRLADAE